MAEQPKARVILKSCATAAPAASQKTKDRHNGRSLLIACSAFGDNWRRRRSFALAVVRSFVLCKGHYTRKSQQCCRQNSNLLHESIPLLTRHERAFNETLSKYKYLNLLKCFLG